MSGLTLLLLVLVGSLFLGAGPAAAALIPRAEEGAVPILYDLAPVPTPGLVAKGEVAWTEQVRPAKVVRTLADAPKRNRPMAPAVPAGSLLFGYQLSSGFAYCPRFGDRPGSLEVQCFRDLDGDGTFDASYVTERYGGTSDVLAGMVHELQPMGKLAYAVADPQEGAPVRMEWIFDGIRRGKATFRARVDGDMSSGRWTCEPAGEGVCVMSGRQVTMRVEGDRIQVEALTDTTKTIADLHSKAVRGASA